MTLSELKYQRNNALQQAVNILQKDKSAEAFRRIISEDTVQYSNKVEVL